ncbi:hypothetical protein AB0C80_18510 [Streptomyces anthocyanicus]|uniref:hypothetical protein n=1 Tax=Streptomyces anthocyanicus TaxID=68174 RepID=UPI0033E71906
MRVVVREAFRAYINMQPEDFTVGQKIKGDTAVRLLRSGAAVEPDDDAARELTEQLRGDEDDGQEQEPDPPHEPPSGGTGDGPAHPEPSTPPAPSHDAPVKDLLAWVGEDPARAQEVLELERAKDQPRSTLVKQLEKIATA